MRDKDPLKRFGLAFTRDGRPPKKVLARQWMFDTYRAVSGNTRLPRDLQYWTLSGQIVVDEDRRQLQPMCEALQAIHYGLIHPSQYIGVERRRDTYEANTTQQDLSLTLEYGEVDDVMFDYVERGGFRPGLINLDTTNGPQRAVSLLARVNRVLRHAPATPLVIFLNLQMGNIWNRIKQDRDSDVVSAIQGSVEVSGMLLDEGWQLSPATWRYGGTGAGSRSSMRIYCFVRGFCISAREAA